ncbi:hypothetical protein AgCh_035328 [Apium graveolens]
MMINNQRIARRIRRHDPETEKQGAARSQDNLIVTLMDQPAVGEETFILKTNIHSDVCLKNMEKILQHIQGVRRIFLHPNEIGKVTIAGTIDPQKLIEILLMNGIESEHVLGASIDQKDLPNFPRPNSPLKHVVNYEVNLQRRKMG